MVGFIGGLFYLMAVLYVNEDRQAVIRFLEGRLMCCLRDKTHHDGTHWTLCHNVLRWTHSAASLSKLGLLVSALSELNLSAHMLENTQPFLKTT